MDPFYKNKWFINLVKYLFLGVVVSFICYKVYAIKDDLNFDFLSQISVVGYWLIGLSFFLVSVNWGIEAIKWYELSNTIQKTTFIRAFKAVLSGISTGVITPNRMGNFIGRIAFLDRENRFKGTVLTILGNLAQFTSSIFSGMLALILLYDNQIAIPVNLIYWAGFILLVLGLFFYFRLNVFISVLPPYFKSLSVIESLKGADNLPGMLKFKILFYSFSRYFVFTLQYVFFLVSFEVNSSIINLWLHVNVIFLIMTIIPSLFFGKLFVREAAAILVLGWLDVPVEIILLSGFLLWLFNIGIPALVGSLFIVQKK
jgi:hypothetical protein